MPRSLTCSWPPAGRRSSPARSCFSPHHASKSRRPRGSHRSSMIAAQASRSSGGSSMRSIVLLITLLAALTSCAQLIGLEGVTSRHYVGGRVHGLWDGADGVTLQLEVEGVNTMLTISSNGDFHFHDSLVSGTSYAVTV